MDAQCGLGSLQAPLPSTALVNTCSSMVCPTPLPHTLSPMRELRWAAAAVDGRRHPGLQGGTSLEATQASCHTSPWEHLLGCTAGPTGQEGPLGAPAVPWTFHDICSPRLCFRESSSHPRPRAAGTGPASPALTRPGPGHAALGPHGLTWS